MDERNRSIRTFGRFLVLLGSGLFTLVAFHRGEPRHLNTASLESQADPFGRFSRSKRDGLTSVSLRGQIHLCCVLSAGLCRHLSLRPPHQESLQLAASFLLLSLGVAMTASPLKSITWQAELRQQ